MSLNRRMSRTAIVWILSCATCPIVTTATAGPIVPDGYPVASFGWYGGGFDRGLAMGSLAGRQGYYGACILQRRVVGYTVSGRPITKRVRLCN